MKTINQLLKVKYPLIQAPMAGVQDSRLAIEVSNVGALGSLPCAMLSKEDLISELKKIKEQITNPVNLNFFCHKQPEDDKKREAEWLNLLQPYFIELGIDSSSIPTVTNRTPFSKEHLDILKDFTPSVVSFHFGLPDKSLLEPLKEWGVTIMSSATTVEESVWLEQNGADVVIAQGLEAGGHRGMFLTDDITTQTGTFALVPQIVKNVSVPVIAAGGIADAKGISAAKNLGAVGVQIGTSYLLCNEALTSPVHREALKSKESIHTALTNIFTGRPARGIVNKIMRELSFINSSVPQFPKASLSIGLLRLVAEKSNNKDYSPLWAGENVSGCKSMSAKELTLNLVKDSL